MKISFIFFILTLLISAPAFAVPTLILGSATVSGTTVSFPITLLGAQGSSITGIVADIIFNRTSSAFALKMEGNDITSATLGAAAIAAGKSMYQSAPFGPLHIVISSFDNIAISDGIVAQISVDIISAATSNSESFAMVSKAPRADGSGDFSFPNSILAAPPTSQLTVTLVGNGDGSLNSVPSGLACTGGSCSANFYTGSDVTITPTAATSSSFGPWTGDCAGSGDCTVSMTANRSATASFALNNTVRIGDNYYGTLNSAYTNAPLNAIMLTRGVTFFENLDLNLGLAVTLAGGYESTFQSRPGYTTIDGTLTISNGSFVADRLMLQ